MIRNLLGAAAIAGAMLASTAASAQCVYTEDGTYVYTVDLMAGQDILAGSLSVMVNGDDLEVTYDLDEGWLLTEAQLWIGFDEYLTGLPLNRGGNPEIGHFPYKTDDDPEFSPPVEAYTFSVPLVDLGFACPADPTTFYAVAHAAVFLDGNENGYFDEGEQEETAFGCGEDGGWPRWGCFFSFDLTCDCDDPEDPGDGCETAFAYLDEETSTCFPSGRWGWYTLLEEEGRYTFDLIAGAGNDCSGGTLVGQMLIYYEYYTVYWDFIYTSPYYMGTGLDDEEEGEHFFAREVGSETPTSEEYSAPGQYEIQPDLEGPIYVIGHAVVCGF